MAEIRLETLSVEGFARYGIFADMSRPKGEHIGEGDVLFYRDMLGADMAGRPASLSVCVARRRQLAIETMEHHTHCDEVTLPLDGDIAIFVAAASPPGALPGPVEAFRVPCGTAVVLRPGVWHGAPYPLDCETVHALVVLPQRTYANDCTEVPLAKRIEATG